MFHASSSLAREHSASCSFCESVGQRDFRFENSAGRRKLNNMPPKKIYVPPVNPLPKVEPVRPYIKKDGTVVHGFLRKPPFRRAVN